MMRKKAIVIIIGIVCAAVLVPVVAYVYYQLAVNPSRKSVPSLEESAALTDVLSKAEAMEDMEYMKKILEDFHPAWSRDGDEEMTAKVEARYEEEIEKISEEVTVLELWQAASGVIHEMEDAHTRVSVNRKEEEKGFYLDDNWVSINGIGRDEIYRKFLDVWPYELESYAKTRFEKFIVYEEYMNLVGIDTSKGIDVTYEKNGAMATEHMA